MDLVLEPADFQGWIPARVRWLHGQPSVEWCYLGDLRLTDPFFDDTIVTAARRPFSLIFRHHTGIDFLERVNEALPGVAPSGFIFHMSRCGSTLLSQMLAAVPETIVISEASPIDFAVRAPHAPRIVEEAERRRWLKGIIGALGRTRREESKLFIKFDAWHICYLSIIREAFPDVPWIFLYRDPVEVLVSHQQSPSVLLVPGMVDPRAFGMDLPFLPQSGPAEYGARVLRQFLRAAASNIRRGGGRLVKYTQLPEILFSELLRFFNTSLSPEAQRLMRESARYDAKNRGMVFEADGARKQSLAGPALQEIAERVLRPAYGELEKLRAIQLLSSQAKTQTL